MKILFILIFILLNTPNLFAQLSGQAKIDSLLKELPKIKEDTNGVNLLYNLSFEFKGIDPQVGIGYAENGIELAKSIKWKQGESNCLFCIGLLSDYLSNYPKSMKYYNLSLTIRQEIKDFRGEAHCIDNMGLLYSYSRDYKKAMDFYVKALRIRKKINDKKGISNSLENIGYLLFNQKEYIKALTYYNQALEKAQTSGNKIVEASVNLKIAIYYNMKGQYAEAMNNYLKAIDIYKNQNHTIGIIDGMRQLGIFLIKLSKDTTRINSNEIGNLISNNKLKNFENGINYLNQVIRLLTDLGDLDMRSRTLAYLANAYEYKGEYKKAYFSHKEYKKLQDSVFNQLNNNKIAALEKSNEEDLKQKEIEKQEIQLKAQEDEKQLIILSAVGALLSVLIILYVIIIQQRKSDKLLYNVLPKVIANRLKKKEHPISDHFNQASIIFIDIVGFTKMSKDADPRRIVEALNKIFTHYDTIADKYGLEKIKTIGDSYMASAGIPIIQKDNTLRAAKMALEVRELMKDYKTSDGTTINVRIGIDCGAVVAGVIGEKKFIYDLWSDAVNTASRMESTGESGQIQITDNFKTELEKFEGNWNFTLRGEFEIKGKGLMKTYYLE